MAENNQHIDQNLSDEELFNRAFQDLSPEDQAIVEGITQKVNERVGELTGYTPAPSRPNWYLYGGIGAGVIAIVLTVALWDGNEALVVDHETPASEEIEEVSPEQTNEDFVPTMSPTEDVITDDGLAETTHEASEITEFSSTDQELPNEVADLIEQINHANQSAEVETTDTQDEERVEYVNDHQVVNMSVVDVEIFSERPLLDNGGGSSNTNSVNDPHIGNATNNNNKSVSYDPEDLPAYYGGQAALKDKVLELTKHIKLEDSSGEMKATIVYFVVNHKGKIEDLQIMAPISDEIDKQVIDAMNKLPLWGKGKKKWKLEYVISITFS